MSKVSENEIKVGDGNQGGEPGGVSNQGQIDAKVL